MNFTNGVNSPGIFHKFRSWSELKDESKGGYMEGEFNVPHGTQTITLENVTKEKTAHPHLLFITPSKKAREEKGNKKAKNDKQNTMTARDYKVVLKLDENGKFQVEKPDYVSGRIIDLVGPGFWNPETRTIKLGKDGLQLTVLKSGQRQKMKFLDEVNKERNVQKFEEGKVVLQVTFDGNDRIWPIFLLDKKQFFIQIQLCYTSRICNTGEHVIFLKFEKASITTDKEKLLELVLYQKHEKIFYPTARSSDVQKLGDTFAFKVDARNLWKNQEAYLNVKLNDPDVPENCTAEFLSVAAPQVKVKEHDPSPGADCLCEDSLKFFNLFKNGKKRNNSESSTNSKKKLCQNSPMTSSNSPTTGYSTASDFSPIYSVEGNGSPDGIIDAMDNPVQSQYVPEILLENMLPSVENIPELNEIPDWEKIFTEMVSDGLISSKKEKILPKCWFCNAKPTLTDYVTKLSYVFDKKFLLFMLMSCIFSIVIMKIE